MDYVSPAVAAAAQSTRDEGELRSLLRKKLETRDAYEIHRRVHDIRNADSLTIDERLDFEVESQTLWQKHYDACLAVAAYSSKRVA